jgi:hypothetical protein
VVHVRPVSVLWSLGDGFLDEAANLDGLQRDKSVEVCFRGFADVVGDRPLQIAFCGFEFPFDSGIQRSSGVAFFSREVGEIPQRKALVSVDAIFFELSSKFVFERVPRTEDGTSDGRALI